MGVDVIFVLPPCRAPLGRRPCRGALTRELPDGGGTGQEMEVEGEGEMIMEMKERKTWRRRREC